MKEQKSFYVDKSIAVSEETFKAYINCFNELATDKSKIPNKEQILTTELIKAGKSDGKNPSNVWSSYYTNALELGIYYEENNQFMLGDLAKKYLNGEIDFGAYMYQYACNLELPINGNIIHPLVEIVDNLDNDLVFNFNNYTNANSNLNIVDDTSKKSLRTFFGRLISAGIFKKLGNNYQLAMSLKKLKSDITYSNLSYDNFKTCFIDSNNQPQKNIVMQMINRVKVQYKMTDLNVIFYGPAGTGKTYTTVERAVEIIDGTIDGKERSEITARFEELKNNHQISFVTFHQSFSYEEFVEGISVTTNEKTLQTEYKIKDGIFKLIAKEAEKNSSQNYVLIIDEINRGNVSKIFGELITLLEPSKRLGNTEQLTVKLPYTQEEFGVPKNLYIIGTMNSSDRSLTALDVAMRRRFKFEELLPNTNLFTDIIIEGIEIQSLLEAINERIEHLIGRDYCIGHAYFTLILETTNQTFENLTDIFKNQVLPLLQEYFYSDWEKIDLVLGQNQFLQKKELLGKSLQLFQAKSITLEDLWSINSNALKDSQNYIAIYKDISKEVDAKDSILV